MNKVILIGNLTRDPELTTTSSGVSVCKMSIAVNRNFTNANGEREADYINAVTWRDLADNCSKYLVKGKKVGVVGSIQTRSYETDEGGKRYIMEVMASEVEFLSSKDSDARPAPPPANKSKVNQTSIPDDELPF